MSRLQQSGLFTGPSKIAINAILDSRLLSEIHRKIRPSIELHTKSVLLTPWTVPIPPSLVGWARKFRCCIRNTRWRIWIWTSRGREKEKKQNLLSFLTLSV